MNFQPLGDRVLVEVVKEEKKTASGIIIPDTAKEKPSRGKIVAISEDVKNINVGDNVIFTKYAGTELKLDNKDYLVVNIKDILGLLK